MEESNEGRLKIMYENWHLSACGAGETEYSCGCCHGDLVHIFLSVSDVVVTDGKIG